MPKYHADYTKYKTPIGPEEFQSFLNAPDKENWYTQVDYGDPDRGRNALKLIDQAEWEGDAPAADLRTAHQRMEKAVAVAEAEGKDGTLVVRRYRRFIGPKVPELRAQNGPARPRLVPRSPRGSSSSMRWKWPGATSRTSRRRSPSGFTARCAAFCN